MKREALHWRRGSVKTTLLFTLEESNMEYGAAEVCLHSFTNDTGVCMSCGMSEASVRLSKKPKPAIPADTPRASWYATISDGQHPFASWLSVDLCTFYAEVDVNVLGTERFAELVTELTMRGIRDRAEREYVVARNKGLGVWAKEKLSPYPEDDVGIPYDPSASAWARLAESFEEREPRVAVKPGALPPGTKVDGFSKEMIYIGKDGSISRVDGWPSQPMTKTEAQIHHLTSVLGSREKALDAWKAAHLDDRAKRNANNNPPTPPKPGEAEARYQAHRVEIDRRDALAAAMSRPIAAEKSMRAQVLLREDD